MPLVRRAPKDGAGREYTEPLPPPKQQPMLAHEVVMPAPPETGEQMLYDVSTFTIAPATVTSSAAIASRTALNAPVMPITNKVIKRIHSKVKTPSSSRECAST